MEIRDLKTFSAVAGLLSFSRAAEMLNTAQSTVSARIAALEEELGVRLFERLSHKIALTDAGLRLGEFARKILDLEDEARAWVAGASEIGGSLTVRVPESLCVYRMDAVIGRLREQFPLVRLSLITCALDGLESDLRQGVTDLAFVYTDSISAADLRVELLGVETLVVSAAPSHALARQPELSLRSFAGATLLLSKADCAYRRAFEGLLAEEGVAPGPSLEFSSLAALKRCLSRGLGVSILPAVAVQEEVARGSLAVLPWTGDALQTGVLMVWHREKWISPLLESFMALMREEGGRQLQDGSRRP
jgi:DNA-binding transcriptional LysR family regulator